MRMPRFRASACESETLPSEEYIEGIVTPSTFSAPSARAASAQVTAESIPPERPMTACGMQLLRR